MFPPNFKPELIMLPFKASIRETGQTLNLAQSKEMIAQGRAGFVRIERSYRGAPEAIGWTMFEITPCAYVHTGDPLFAEERTARQHMKKTYAAWSEFGSTPAHPIPLCI